jgi:hypothetical protein
VTIEANDIKVSAFVFLDGVSAVLPVNNDSVSYCGFDFFDGFVSFHGFIRSPYLLLGVLVSRGIGSGFGQSHIPPRNAVQCLVGK